MIYSRKIDWLFSFTSVGFLFRLTSIAGEIPHGFVLQIPIHNSFVSFCWSVSNEFFLVKGLSINLRGSPTFLPATWDYPCGELAHKGTCSSTHWSHTPIVHSFFLNKHFIMFFGFHLGTAQPHTELIWN